MAVCTSALPTHSTALWGETAETHRSFSKDYWHEPGKQHINFVIRLCKTCIDNHKSSARCFLLMTCINLVYFNIISQGFSFITHSFYRGGEKPNLYLPKKPNLYLPKELLLCDHWKVKGVSKKEVPFRASSSFKSPHWTQQTKAAAPL